MIDRPDRNASCPQRSVSATNWIRIAATLSIIQSCHTGSRAASWSTDSRTSNNCGAHPSNLALSPRLTSPSPSTTCFAQSKYSRRRSSDHFYCGDANASSITGSASTRGSLPCERSNTVLHEGSSFISLFVTRCAGASIPVISLACVRRRIRRLDQLLAVSAISFFLFVGTAHCKDSAVTYLSGKSDPAW